MRRVPGALWAPLGVVAGVVVVALVVPLLPLEDPVRMVMEARLAGPSVGHPLGRDEYGRDVLSRILWGARVSLGVAAVSTLAAGVVGTALGVLGGYFRGVVELVTVRAAEVVLCLPPLLLALLVVALLGPGAGTLVLCLGILFAPGYARVAYAETLSLRALDYVVAQQALGTHPVRIMLRTVLPNILPALIVQVSLTLAATLVLESGLSFLGLGVVPPAPSWGTMIRGARSTMDQAPLLLVWPCLALSGVVIVLNALCDRLREVLDPRPGGRLVLARGRVMGGAEPGVGGLLRLRGLTLRIAGLEGAPAVVRDVSLGLDAGETLALVGESGSGKTLTSLALMGLLPPAIEVVAGRADFTGRDGVGVDLLGLSEEGLRRLRGDQVSMIFQDPAGSMDPMQRVGAQVEEAILVHRGVSRRAAAEEAVRLLDAVGMPDAGRRARAWPHELSGGQKQRAMIAGAIANGPLLLIADEPTTALDVTIQAQILALLARRQAESGMGMILVTHNLAVVAEGADRVAIMYAGEIVELGAAGEVLGRPRHPYTAALLASVPEGDAVRLASIAGAVPQPHQFPPGCRFAARCGLVTEACRAGPPGLVEIAAGHEVRCLHWSRVGVEMVA